MTSNGSSIITHNSIYTFVVKANEKNKEQKNIRKQHLKENRFFLEKAKEKFKTFIQIKKYSERKGKKLFLLTKELKNKIHACLIGKKKHASRDIRNKLNT